MPQRHWQQCAHETVDEFKVFDVDKPFYKCRHCWATMEWRAVAPPTLPSGYQWPAPMPQNEPVPL